MCRAVTFIQELRQRCENLSQFPEGQPRFPELGPDAHYCVHGRYLILYRVLTDQVSIERILHGARNIINLIAEDQ
jgi:toxin ParE1/3/4